MSMHQMEGFVEEAVIAVASLEISILDKRNLIHTLFDMEEYGDCSFTNLRTINEMTECQYTFLFEPNEMFDYESRKEFYDDPNEMTFGDELLYKYDGKICVDSGSNAWKGMVKAGKITSEGAKPVTILPYIDVIRTVRPLIDDNDDYILEGLSITAMLTGAADELNDEEFEYTMGMTKEEYEEDM